MSSAATAGRATHVLLVCESLRVTGGVERFVCQLGNELVALGLTVTLGNVDAERAAVVYPLDPRVRVAAGATTLPAAGGRGLGRALALLRARWRVGRALGRVVDSARADVVVLNGVVTACTLLALRPGWARRSICCDHNHFDARSRLWRRLRARFYPRVAAVVSLTEADAPRFSTLNANTHVIANASALSAAEPAVPQALRVLAVGRHQAQKGFDLLLRAWVEVVAELPSARLRIVGEGPLGPELARLASELGVAASVDWTAPTAAIEPLYREAAVFALSSRYEGMPLALLEAQALGVPAVAFDCPTGPREILADDTGIVVAAGDVAGLAAAIVALLGDERRRARMAAAAIARSRALFGLRRHVDQWAALIDEVAGRARAPSAP
jgi:glycosyltransferase involved in cell wall biosynthesis